MHRLTPRSFYIALPLILFLFSVTALAQGPTRQVPDPSYDVVLQVIIGSDEKTSNGQLPQGLSSVTKQLRANYNFAEFKLANTYVGRVTNGGDFSFKSVSNLFGRGAASERPSFLEWSLSGFRSESKDAGKNDLGLQTFRFGARIPIVTGYMNDGAGKQLPNYNYEGIGLTSSRISLAENTPTLLGSLSLPNTDNSMFLVLTLRPV